MGGKAARTGNKHNDMQLTDGVINGAQWRKHSECVRRAGVLVAITYDVLRMARLLERCDKTLTQAWSMF